LVWQAPYRIIGFVALVIAATLSASAAGMAGVADRATGLQSVELVHQGTHRSYLVAVPDGTRGGAPVAAVMVFHGGGGDGQGVARLTGFASAAVRGRFVAVFPNGGRDGSEPWNDGRRTTASEKDDVGFVMAIIDRLVAANNVDPRRIFAAGVSNGGMFVQRLACEASGRFAAYAAVIANLPADLEPRCAPSTPVPMLLISATDDAVMPWAGGEIAHRRRLGIGAGGLVISTPETAHFWARANGCANEPTRQPLPDRVDDGTTIVRHAYSGCRENAAVTLYEIQGGGHVWPGGAASASRRIAGARTQELDATAVIVEFFRQYGL
jgi:polyhydroxybutyrate depolymerase